MSLRRWYLFTCIVLFLDKLVAYPTIIVDRSGHGNFSTIQSAIASVPSNNMHWICIYIKAGTYREKVTIPMDKPYIMLKGDGKRKTHIIWDDHDNVAQSPTFGAYADNFIAKSITFTNSYNYPPAKNGNPRVPAVAAMITGDKSSFYRCGFFGMQDTLWDVQGRHYFKHCTIVGAVDFIFGMGQSIYEKCSISVIGAADLNPYLPGFITAQGRTSEDDENGFVFKECSVFGIGRTFLGRPWRDYARVLFYNTSMSNIIEAEGWDPWNSKGHEYRVTFAEHGNYGLGSNTSMRVSWEKKLSPETLQKLISMSFIDAEGWLNKQPFHMR